MYGDDYKMAAYIHHVQLCTRNGAKYVQKFVQNANFKLFAERSTESIRQWAVRSGSAVFVINQPLQLHDHDDVIRTGIEDCRIPQSCSSLPGKSLDSSSVYVHREINPNGLANQRMPKNNQELPVACFSTTKDQTIDTVFNVALEVGNIEQCVDRAQQNGAKILCEPTMVQDTNGKVVIAAVQSCIGNVIHTLLNTKEYQGVFLPGFHCTSENSLDSELCRRRRKTGEQHVEEELTSHVDHITYACQVGASGNILDWYEKCFGMKRFKLSRDEDDSDGFLVEGQNVGLRMKAMEYWRCAETGLAMSTGDSMQYPKTKFVIAEALPGQGPNQVETFLDHHGGSGIQHIGLYAPDIIETVKVLKNTGLDFIQPPGSYYTEIGKLKEILEVGENMEVLKRLGILLDAESFYEDQQDEAMCNKISRPDEDGGLLHRYLMQIFTKPIFDRDTFFLEIIQRCGATGFGAGNITALWRAVEAYMEHDDKTKENQIDN